jgi:large subunit ribosomal protein L13
MTTSNTHTIDAKDMKLGRVANKAAAFLMGKNLTNFARNVIPQVSVKIVNASKADIGEKKLTEKKYVRYTGYPGGLRAPIMRDVIAKKGHTEVFRLAVYGMLPPNKLRPRMMKNLIITE